MNLYSKGCPVSKIVNSMEVQILVLARQDPVNDTYEATGEMYNRVIRHLLKGTDKENTCMMSAEEGLPKKHTGSQQELG